MFRRVYWTVAPPDAAPIHPARSATPRSTSAEQPVPRSLCISSARSADACGTSTSSLSAADNARAEPATTSSSLRAFGRPRRHCSKRHRSPPSSPVTLVRDSWSRQDEPSQTRSVKPDEDFASLGVRLAPARRVHHVDRPCSVLADPPHGVARASVKSALERPLCQAPQMCVRSVEHAPHHGSNFPALIAGDPTFATQVAGT